jgi:hypothetical protein
MAALSALGFRSLSLLALAGLTSLAACEKKTPEPAAAQTSPLLSVQPKLPPPAAAPIGSAPQEPMRITWEDPPTFKRVPPPNPMRKASFVVPRAEGDPADGDISVSYFGPGQGGSIDANVDRWVKQFGDVKPGDVKRADREANGLRQHTVELESGSFAGMGSADKAKADYGLIGAIIETPSGTYFFKLTGPSKTVKQAKAEFYKLLDSIKPS